MKYPKVIGIAGKKGSGKGTVAELINLTSFEKLSFSAKVKHVVSALFCKDRGMKEVFYKTSFAAKLKDITSILFSWDRAMLEGDTEESREAREKVDKYWSEALRYEGLTPRIALQYIGTRMFRERLNQQFWVLCLEAHLRKNPDKAYIISDVRFPNELDFIKKIGGISVRVRRCGQDESDTHPSETALDDTPDSEFDYVIENDGSLQDLKCKVARIQWT